MLPVAEYKGKPAHCGVGAVRNLFSAWKQDGQIRYLLRTKQIKVSKPRGRLPAPAVSQSIRMPPVEILARRLWLAVTRAFPQLRGQRRRDLILRLEYAANWYAAGVTRIGCGSGRAFDGATQLLLSDCAMAWGIAAGKKPAIWQRDLAELDECDERDHPSVTIARIVAAAIGAPALPANLRRQIARVRRFQRGSWSIKRHYVPMKK
jgi:hypothetical protein